MNEWVQDELPGIKLPPWQSTDPGVLIPGMQERITKLEELVDELLVVYYNQDDDKIRELRKELDI